jgi:prolyl 4-hydroxylase
MSVTFFSCNLTGHGACSVALQVTRVPVNNQEALLVLRYIDGEKYEPHWDYLLDKKHSDRAKGGQRFVTILMYLSTVLEGGETVFPRAERKVSGPEWSECALRGNAVKAVKGNAVMFYDLHPDGTPDPSSMHGSCPTLNGQKWCAAFRLSFTALAHCWRVSSGLTAG